MDSKKDKIKGAFNSSVGKVKEAAGIILGDAGLEDRGNTQKNLGKSQQMQGAIKENIHKGTQALGASIEMVGKKLQDKKAPKKR